jgi:hypothetical protein
VYTDFSKAFGSVLQASRSVEVQFVNFGGLLFCWMGSYLTGRTQLVKLEDYLSESIQGHYSSFWILTGALDLFENVSVLETLTIFFFNTCGARNG